MFLLQANSIKKSYGTRTILDFERFTVYEGDRIGVVGANGAGKSTLLAILSGELRPDEGAVVRRCEVAFVRQLEQRDETKSGGENAKAAFRQEAARSEAVFFADEPTANLDASGQAWVRRTLEHTRTLLLVSHDRDLLDAVCTRIVEVRDGALHHYTGNYSAYEAAVAEERARQELEYDKYRRKRGQLEAAVQNRDRKSSAMRKAPSRMGNSEARLGAFKAREQQEKVERDTKVLRARLERMEKVEKPRDPVKLRMDFSLTDPPGNRYVIRCEELHFFYGKREVLRGASFLVERGRRLALTGDNGSGKTTLLRLLHEGHPAVTRAPKLKTGWLHQDFSDLDEGRSVLDNAMLSSIQDMASARSVLAGLLFSGDEVHKKVGALSGGERMRLSLAKLMLGDYNALLLDEPTNYLDLRSLRAVAGVLAGYPGTLILVSHDARFRAEVCDGELRLEHGLVHRPEAQAVTAAPADHARRTLLELRATRLIADISSAPPDKKTELERQYGETMRELKALR